MSPCHYIFAALLLMVQAALNKRVQNLYCNKENCSSIEVEFISPLIDVLLLIIYRLPLCHRLAFVVYSFLSYMGFGTICYVPLDSHQNCAYNLLIEI